MVIDCVNPWGATRAIFAAAAQRTGARLLGVETVCSDPALHRARAEAREMDVPGLSKPGWSRIVSRSYTPWAEADLCLDTARVEPAEAVAEIVRLVPGSRARPA